MRDKYYIKKEQPLVLQALTPTAPWALFSKPPHCPTKIFGYHIPYINIQISEIWRNLYSYPFPPYDTLFLEIFKIENICNNCIETIKYWPLKQGQHTLYRHMSATPLITKTTSNNRTLVISLEDQKQLHYCSMQQLINYKIFVEELDPYDHPL